MAFTYILKCRDGTFYTGWTVNIYKRVVTHNKGKGAKYTRSRLPVTLVYWEMQENRSLAQKREAYIRRLPRKKKHEIIERFKKSGRYYSPLN